MSTLYLFVDEKRGRTVVAVRDPLRPNAFRVIRALDAAMVGGRSHYQNVGVTPVWVNDRPHSDVVWLKANLPCDALFSW